MYDFGLELNVDYLTGLDNFFIKKQNNSFN